MSEKNPIRWIKDAYFLAMPYWRSRENLRSLLLIVLVVIFNLLIVYMTVLFNKWYNVFYDAIQHFCSLSFILYKNNTQKTNK